MRFDLKDAPDVSSFLDIHSIISHYNRNEFSVLSIVKLHESPPSAIGCRSGPI